MIEYTYRGSWKKAKDHKKLPKYIINKDDIDLVEKMYKIKQLRNSKRPNTNKGEYKMSCQK